MGEQASKMGEVADASVARRIQRCPGQASSRVDDLSSTYEEVSEGLTGLVKASAEGANTGAGLARMNENLLVERCVGTTPQMQQNELFASMRELVNLNDSVEHQGLQREHLEL